MNTRRSASLSAAAEEPVVLVSIRAGNRSAQEMENLGADPLEQRLMTNCGVQSITTSARAGKLDLAIECRSDAAVPGVLADVRSTVDALARCRTVDSVRVRRVEGASCRWAGLSG